MLTSCCWWNLTFSPSDDNSLVVFYSLRSDSACQSVGWPFSDAVTLIRRTWVACYISRTNKPDLVQQLVRHPHSQRSYYFHRFLFKGLGRQIVQNKSSRQCLVASSRRQKKDRWYFSSQWRLLFQSTLKCIDTSRLSFSFFFLCVCLFRCLLWLFTEKEREKEKEMDIGFVFPLVAFSVLFSQCVCTCVSTCVWVIRWAWLMVILAALLEACWSTSRVATGFALSPSTTRVATGRSPLWSGQFLSTLRCLPSLPIDTLVLRFHMVAISFHNITFSLATSCYSDYPVTPGSSSMPSNHRSLSTMGKRKKGKKKRSSLWLRRHRIWGLSFDWLMTVSSRQHVCAIRLVFPSVPDWLRNGQSECCAHRLSIETS